MNVDEFKVLCIGILTGVVITLFSFAILLKISEKVDISHIEQRAIELNWGSYKNNTFIYLNKDFEYVYTGNKSKEIE